jgi:L-lactate dehydrogenase complex protein LldG
MATEARAVILGRIAAATQHPAPRAAHEDDWSAIPRTYRSTSSVPIADLIELLEHRLHDYDAQVLTVSAARIRDSVAAMLKARGVRRILLPEGFPAEYLPEGFDFAPDNSLTTAELNACDGVLTSSTLAIAETGTIVLQNVAGQGRRAASLVPDYHLCLVQTSTIVATVPEAIARLNPTAELPTTFISGPSATADIEMTRIKGVHGPRFLDVILITA